MADDTEHSPASGTPAWPDPYPSGPYASVPYPTGPYASGLASQPAPSVPEQDPAQPAIAQIGDMEVSSTAVRTPVGIFPLRGSAWTVQDQWVAVRKTPTWAVVCAVAGFAVLAVFSLLFLLVKRPVYSGAVQVTVTIGRFTYEVRIPVTDEAQVRHLHELVTYIRSVA